MVEPVTITGQRVTRLETQFDRMEGQIDTIQSTVHEIAQSMVRIRDVSEASAREASVFRKEVRHDIKCITDTWSGFQSEFGPMLTELKDKREEAADTRKKLKIAWLTAGGIGIGGAIMTVLNSWASNVLKAVKTLGGG